MIESENKKKADFFIKHDKFLSLSSLLGVMAFGGLSFMGYQEGMSVMPSVAALMSALGVGVLIKNPFTALAQKYLNNLAKEGQDIILTKNGRENQAIKGFSDIVQLFSELVIHTYPSNKRSAEAIQDSLSHFTLAIDKLYLAYPTLMKEVYQTYFKDNGLVGHALVLNLNVDTFLALSDTQFTLSDEKVLKQFLIEYSNQDEYGIFSSETMKDESLFKSLPQSIQSYVLNKYEPFTSLARKNDKEGKQLHILYTELYNNNPFASLKEVLSDSPSSHQTSLSLKQIKDKNRQFKQEKEQMIVEQELNSQHKTDRKINFKSAMVKIKSFTTQCEQLGHVDNLASMAYLDFEKQFNLAEELIDFIHHHQYQNIFHDELFYLKNDVMTFYSQLSEEFSLLSQLKELKKQESDLSDITQRFSILNQKIIVIEHKLHAMLEDKIENLQSTHNAHFKAKL